MTKKLKQLSEKELLSRVEYNERSDRFGKVFMPNDIFEILTNDDELQNKGTSSFAVAYCYTFFITWLYRNAKYGVMHEDNYKVSSIKEILGYTATNKTIDFIIKDGGILDELGLTRKGKIKDAPFEYDLTQGYLEFYTREDLDKMQHPKSLEEWKEIRGSSKNTSFKEPLFALYNEDEEYGEGTFYRQDNTHEIDFKIFVKCMTNPNLGCTAFYLYALLKHKCDVNRGQIEIGGDKISSLTGIKQRAREEALDALKKHNLVNCVPAPYIIGAGKGEGANVYSVKGIDGYTSTPIAYQKREILSKEQQEKKEKIIKEIESYAV